MQLVLNPGQLSLTSASLESFVFAAYEIKCDMPSLASQVFTEFVYANLIKNTIMVIRILRNIYYGLLFKILHFVCNYCLSATSNQIVFKSVPLIHVILRN